MTRLLFAGTPAFARASLEALLNADMRPVAVLTQPDRPAGRGKKLKQSLVKEFAVENDLQILQPKSLASQDVLSELTAFNADLLIVAAYGLLLPQSVLDIPSLNCLNVHASLLPRWRGAAPIQAAILAGDQYTGTCLMQMEVGLDTGPVYATARLEIGASETAGELHDRLAYQGGELLVRHIDDIVRGELQAVEQDGDDATYAKKICSADAELDWGSDASDLVRVIRAYNPVPGAWTVLNGERVKCWRAAVIETIEHNDYEPGSVVGVTPDGIDVSCGSGTLHLTELQRPGRKRVSAAGFSNQPGLDRAVFGSTG